MENAKRFKTDNARTKNEGLSNSDEMNQIVYGQGDELENGIVFAKNKENTDVQETLSSTAPEKRHPSYKLVAIPGKGMGMVATRDIEKGELVLEEDPVLQIDSTGSNERDVDYHRMLSSYRSQFPELPCHVQKQIMGLYCSPTTHEKVKNCLSSTLTENSAENENAIKFVSIYVTNAFRILPSDSVGLYLLTARFNHSCRRNLECDYEGTTKKTKAIRPIEKDEELCIYYSHPSLNGFDCICELCCPSSDEEEDQKQMLDRFFNRPNLNPDNLIHPRGHQGPLALALLNKGTFHYSGDNIIIDGVYFQCPFRCRSEYTTKGAPYKKSKLEDHGHGPGHVEALPGSWTPQQLTSHFAGRSFGWRCAHCDQRHWKHQITRTGEYKLVATNETEWVLAQDRSSTGIWYEKYLSSNPTTKTSST